MNNIRQQLSDWAGDGLLSASQFEQASELLEAAPQNRDWLTLINIILLWGAALSITIGVLFFFAYNWQDMGRFTKFALVESALLCAIITYTKSSLHRYASTALLFAIAMLTGVLLALVGQTYQTGADPWQLFATWAGLMLPYCIIGRSNSLWVLFAIVANLAIHQYIDTFHGLFGLLFRGEQMLWIFVLFNSALSVFFESLNTDRLPLLKPIQLSHRVVAQLSVIAAGVSVTWLAMWSIFDGQHILFSGLLGYLTWLGLCYVIYRYVINDLMILAGASLSAIVVTTSLFIHFFEDVLDEGAMLIVSMIIIAMSTAAGMWLKKLAKDFSQQ